MGINNDQESDLKFAVDKLQTILKKYPRFIQNNPMFGLLNKPLYLENLKLEQNQIFNFSMQTLLDDDCLTDAIKAENIFPNELFLDFHSLADKAGWSFTTLEVFKFYFYADTSFGSDDRAWKPICELRASLTELINYLNSQDKNQLAAASEAHYLLFLKEAELKKDKNG